MFRFVKSNRVQLKKICANHRLLLFFAGAMSSLSGSLKWKRRIVSIGDCDVISLLFVLINTFVKVKKFLMRNKEIAIGWAEMSVEINDNIFKSKSLRSYCIKL